MLGLSQHQRKMLLFYQAAQMLRKRLDLTFQQWERKGSQTPQLHKSVLPVVATQAELQLRSAKQLPKDCGVNVCGPHFKCHLVLIQEKKILKCVQCKIQRDKRAPLRQYIYSQDSKNRNQSNYKWKHFHSVFRDAPSFIQKQQLLLKRFPLQLLRCIR